MRKSLLLVPFCLLLSGMAFAEDKQSPECENQTTQADMNTCAADLAAKADDALNAQYKRTRKAAIAWDAAQDEADRGAEKALLAAQRAWIAYRDAECTLEGVSTNGGSMQPLMINGCMERLSKVRSDDLEEIENGLK